MMIILRRCIWVLYVIGLFTQRQKTEDKRQRQNTTDPEKKNEPLKIEKVAQQKKEKQQQTTATTKQYQNNKINQSQDKSIIIIY